MAESDNSALEDARKRARRRLVGAIVLALAAAVVLPMFLESDPKPLGPDVQIQIPAIDDAKFQNRLTPGASPQAPSADKTPPKAADTSKETAPPSPAPAPAPASDTVPAQAEAPAADSPAAAATKKQPEQKRDEDKPADAKVAEAKPAPLSTKAPAVAAVEKKAAPAAASGGFVVQLGAFVDAGVAKELAAKAGTQGFPAFLEPVTTKGGQVQRVRVGPFATRAEADAAEGKLKAAGFTAVARPR